MQASREAERERLTVHRHWLAPHSPPRMPRDSRFMPRERAERSRDLAAGTAIRTAVNRTAINAVMHDS